MAESQRSRKTYNTDEMSDAEFWQRVALEAVVNDDPAKSFALRVEQFFDDAKCRPHGRDACVVEGISHREVDEFLLKDEYDAEAVRRYDSDNPEAPTKVKVTGIKYTEYASEFADD